MEDKREEAAHSHECRARLEECLTRKHKARAEAEAAEVALQLDADIPEELTGQGMEVDERGIAAGAGTEEDPKPCQASPARAVVHKHRVLPNVRSSHESSETCVPMT